MKDDLKELLALTWIAVKEPSKHALTSDECTCSFFSSHSPFPQQHSSLQQSKTAPSLPAAPAAPKAPPPRQEPPRSNPHIEPQQPPPETPAPIPEPPLAQNHRRIEKFLPRPVSLQPSDLSSTRSQMSMVRDFPAMAPNCLYKSLPIQNKFWGIVTYGSISDPKSPKEEFVSSVVKAIGDRLSIQVRTCSCLDPSFSVHMSLLASECDAIICFIEHHHESSFLKLLETVPACSPSEHALDSPFSLYGSIYGKPIRALILHATTHEDPTVKQQLWQRLKSLAASSTGNL